MATLYLGNQLISPMIVSGSTPSGKYQLLQRIKDDSNNEIGTVSGFFTDANDVEYAVVCLDAQYRLANGRWTSASGSVTNLPLYNDASIWTSTDTATFNTQKIIDFSNTSTACNHCRSKSFLIGGITYYGQLPNLVELVDIFRNRIDINSADITASSYPSVIIPLSTRTWSSNQLSDIYAILISSNGLPSATYRTNDYLTCPVLELPNA